MAKAARSPQFSGKLLIQGEPDASSFPSGGIRATFEARGYTAWDVTSPAYIHENPNGNTLCIPTAFCSWTGEALDKKVPLLRSMQALNTQAQRILKLFGHKNPGMVSASAGPEQEYFLIDRNFYFARPDLLNAGRTLFGQKPPKGQELEDQYFGKIPDRVLACMFEAERELYKLGVPVKTRHNEVAPSQYEIAPVYESANIATDHNYQVMYTLQRVAERYGLVCLLAEKPFAGYQRLGQARQLVAGLLRSRQPAGAGRHAARKRPVPGGLRRRHPCGPQALRAAARRGGVGGQRPSAGRQRGPAGDHLGLPGRALTDVFKQIEAGAAKSSKAKEVMHIGVDTLPILPKDAGDRNRTSPFAFTGNKFEFRAVGSSFSISGPLVALNTMMAESLDYMATELEKAEPAKFNEAVQALLTKVIKEHKAILFDGDNYTEEWHAEAGKRGLPNLRTTPEALPEIIKPEVIAMFEKFGVLSERELRSRFEIFAHRYCLDVAIEANLTYAIAQTKILPAAQAFQANLASSAVDMKTLGVEGDLAPLKDVTARIGELSKAIAKLKKEIDHESEGETLELAKHFRDKVIPAMAGVRKVVDGLEEIMPDDMWPLPTYQEMLFIK